MVDNEPTLETYVTNIVMNMYKDAMGVLLNIVPIALRLNIYIVNIDTTSNARVRAKANPDTAIDI